ncbi:transmembrane protein 139-like [Ambystoma mexicanum]|uniref:transmembrane protein 139-like n=1 Tax=Ambystoma mexicanum TaxID=8296 RepID=UPI0037E7344A
MSSVRTWHRITRSLLTLGMTMLIIGIILVTIPGNVFTIGVFFLVAGVIGVIIYLLFTVVMCFAKRPSSPTESEDQAQPGRRNHQDDNQESNAAAYSVPTYDEVVASSYLHPPTEIWTVGLRPGQSPLVAELGEPPPYSVLDIETAGPNAATSSVETHSTDGRSTTEVNATAQHGQVTETHSAAMEGPRLIMPHQLRRISSDIHEILALKDVSMHLEPLTPPPAYLDIEENPFTEVNFHRAE